MTKEQLAELKSKHSLVALASETCDLKDVGGEFLCCCPFHHENTASMRVSDVRFYCFGCKASGDIFKWLMLTKKLTFPQAVTQLLGTEPLREPRTSLPTTPTLHSHPLDFSARNRILRVNWKAQNLFERWGKENKTSLNKRFSDEAIVRFGIGFAPESVGGGWVNPSLFEAGLVAQGDRGFYRRYRDRITIPLKTRSGDILGFIGRTVRDDDYTPKYINPPATFAFSAKRYLFGLDHHVAGNSIIVVEGVIDAISLAGLSRGTTVVSSLGCHLSIEQLRILEHYTNRIEIMYDGDMPGLNGAADVARYALTSSAHIELTLLTDNQDPDTFARAPYEHAAPIIPATDMHERRVMANELRTAKADRSVLDRLAKPYVDDNIKNGWHQYNQIDWVMAAYPQFALEIKEATRKMGHDLDGNQMKEENVLAFIKAWKKACREVRKAHQ